MTKTITHVINGQEYEVPEGYTKLDVMRALSEQNKPKQLPTASSFEAYGAPKVTSKREKDIQPQDEFKYGIQRKLRESLGGVQEFITGKPSMPLEADVASTSGQLARQFGKSTTRLGETILEGLYGAKLGGKFGPVGAAAGGVLLPLIAGYVKEPGPRLSASRALSAVEEAAPNIAYGGLKHLYGGYKLGKTLNELKTKETPLLTAKTEAQRYLTTTQEGVPPEYPRTSQGIASAQATKTKQLQNLKNKQLQLQTDIEAGKPFQNIAFSEKGPKLINLTEIGKMNFPKSVKSEILERNKNQFIEQALKTFSPNIDYNKLAAEEHNKIYNQISNEVSKKYNNVLKDVDKNILAGSKGFNIYQNIAKSLGQKMAPLKNILPEEGALTPEENQLLTGFEGSEKLKSIPTSKVLSYYKTAKQLANKLDSKAWQEANNMTDVQRKNSSDAAEQFKNLSDKLAEVLDKIDPKIQNRIKEADTYFAKNKAPFYARKEHWEAQKGRIDSDILKSTHADVSVAPEASFLRNIIKSNENYRKAVLGKLFGRNFDKLLKEGKYQEYADLINLDPHVKNIHKTLETFENAKKQIGAKEKLEKPLAQTTQATIEQLAQSKQTMSKNLSQHLDKKLSEIKKLVAEKQKGYAINTEKLIQTDKDIEEIQKEIQKFENYKNNLLEAEKVAQKAGYDVKDLQLEIKKARYDLAQHKQKYATLKKLVKGTLATVAAKLYLFK